MIIGIDLGTTNSLAAYFEEDGAKIIPNRLGQSLTPSIVSIDNNGYMKAKRSGKTYISTRINGRKRAFRVKVSGYTITYKNVGINSSKNRERLSGKRAVTLRSPRKKGYTFVGWYDSSGKNVTVIPKGNTKNLILHAKWDKTSSKDSVKAK